MRARMMPAKVAHDPDELSRIYNGRFNVLVPHFPPFTTLPPGARGKPAGPLVELFEDFARTINVKPKFIRLTSWDSYIQDIEDNEVVTIATPVYAEQHPSLQVCAFCQIATGCYVVRNEHLGKFDAALARVVQKQREIDNAELKSTRIDTLMVDLRRCVRELLKTRKADRQTFAIPAGYVEQEIVRDFSLPAPHVFATSNISVLAEIKKSADLGYVVLCSARDTALLSKEPDKRRYRAGYLFGRAFVTTAGIAFAHDEDGAFMRDTFLKFIRRDDREVQSKLKRCVTPGTRILPRSKRAIVEIPSMSAWRWIYGGNHKASQTRFTRLGGISNEGSRGVAREVHQRTQSGDTLDGEWSGELIEIRADVALCWINVGHDGKVQTECPVEPFRRHKLQPGSLFTLTNGELVKVVTPSERAVARASVAQENDRLDKEFDDELRHLEIATPDEED